MRLIAALLGVALACSCTGCGHDPTPRAAADTPSKAVPVQTAAVELRDFPVDEIMAPGKVEFNPNRVSRVLMPVPGRVRRVMVKLGDAVKEGQPLAVIESAEAGLAMAAYTQSRAQVRQTEVALGKAEKDLARARELYANKAAPLKDVVNSEADVELARAALTQVRATTEEALHRLGTLGLDPAHHTYEVSVNAPIRGKILEISLGPGELRNDTSQPLMTIADLSSVWITSEVPESSIRLVRIDEPVKIELVAYPGEKFSGRVRRIADTVAPDTRTIKVQAELDNASGRLRPEMFGRIRHSHGTRRLACVPASAVVHGQGAAWVLLENAPGRFERVRVKPGDAGNGVIPILEGLKEGDRVVVDGAVLLRER